MKELFQPISATVRPEEERFEDAAGTLGAVLYADKTKSRVSEREWAALMERIAAGDQLALRALYERTHRLAFTLIMRITNDRQTAQELTVGVFHDVWCQASTYDAAGGTVLGWIMNRSRSRAIDRFRFEHRKKRIDRQANGGPPSEVEGNSSETVHLTEKERQEHSLREALRLLSADERQAIETAYFSDLTYAEAAARLNQPLGTIKTRIRSGLSKLRHASAKAEPVT